MYQNRMHILDLLHAIIGNHDPTSKWVLHLAAPEACQTYRHGAPFARQFQGFEQVWGIAAVADAERHITGLNRILHLLCKNIRIGGIVCPTVIRGKLSVWVITLSCFTPLMSSIPGHGKLVPLP
jgi:hypothetical protein